MSLYPQNNECGEPDQPEFPFYNAHKAEQALVDSKYKREFCKNFADSRKCTFDFRCRFAHGLSDLVNFKNAEALRLIPLYRRLNCQPFVSNGFCPKGSECEFRHPPIENKEFSKFNEKRLQARMTFKRISFFKSMLRPDLDETQSTTISIASLASDSSKGTTQENVQSLKHSSQSKRTSRLSQLINNAAEN